MKQVWWAEPDDAFTSFRNENMTRVQHAVLKFLADLLSII